jgi:hypothetical protein
MVLRKIDNERVVNTGLCALRDEGCALLSSDSDYVWKHLVFILFLFKHFLTNDFSNDLLKFGKRGLSV